MREERRREGEDGEVKIGGTVRKLTSLQVIIGSDYFIVRYSSSSYCCPHQKYLPAYYHVTRFLISERHNLVDIIPRDSRHHVQVPVNSMDSLNHWILQG